MKLINKYNGGRIKIFIGEENVANIYKCDDLVNYLMANYMSLFPLFSLYFVNSPEIIELETSSYIENHWKSVKNVMKAVPLYQRDVTIYLSHYYSYVKSKVIEFNLVDRNVKIMKKLGKRNISKNSDVFKPNVKKRLKKDVIDSDFEEDDGYMKKNPKKLRVCKFVRRRINFAAIEKDIEDFRKIPKKKKPKTLLKCVTGKKVHLLWIEHVNFFFLKIKFNAYRVYQ